MAEIYALCDPVSGEVRYIGKANDARARLRTHQRDARRRDTPVYRWMRKLTTADQLPQLRVLAVTDDWRDEERRQIAAHREAGARLLNVADGGDEPFCPPEVRRANGPLAAKARGRDPLARRIWELKRELGSALRRGELKERHLAKMREAARRAPHIFGCWAGV